MATLGRSLLAKPFEPEERTDGDASKDEAPRNPTSGKGWRSRATEAAHAAAGREQTE